MKFVRASRENVNEDSKRWTRVSTETKARKERDKKINK